MTKKELLITVLSVLAMIGMISWMFYLGFSEPTEKANKQVKMEQEKEVTYQRRPADLSNDDDREIFCHTIIRLCSNDSLSKAIGITYNEGQELIDIAKKEITEIQNRRNKKNGNIIINIKTKEKDFSEKASEHLKFQKDLERKGYIK